MNRQICVVLYLLILCFLSNAQNVRFPLNNYSNRNYGKMYSSTNLSIIQDSHGLIYVGNANGILEYDGSKWRFISVKNGIWVTSLAIDISDKIYVGSQNEFGYLAPDKVGLLCYKSLSDSLDLSHKDFSNIWEIGEGYFSSGNNCGGSAFTTISSSSGVSEGSNTWRARPHADINDLLAPNSNWNSYWFQYDDETSLIYALMVYYGY